MARTDTLPHFLTDVADAIREKKGTQETIQASDFDTEIENLPSGGGLDWSAIGYSGEPESIEEAYDYAKQIYDNWDPTSTQLFKTFYNDQKILFLPKIDTSNVTYIFQAFMNCYVLNYIPVLDFSKVTSMTNIIGNVQYISDAGLDNILQICIGMEAWTGEKKLSTAWNFSSSNYPASRIQALSHYQDFIDAGWTIGY